MTTMIRLPERWQVVDTPSDNDSSPGDGRQRTDEPAVRTNERNGGRGESSNRGPAAAYDRTFPVARGASREGEHRSAGAVRRDAGSFVAPLASRFEVADREPSGLTRPRWRRSQRPDVVGSVARSASGFGTVWLPARATTDSMAGERSASRVAHAPVAVELQTSRRGVDEPEH